MAGSIGRLGRAAVLAGAMTALLGGASDAAAQGALAMDPYLQGRCPGAEGYEPGFHINFNPKVNAWPVYEPTECGPRHPGEPASAPEPRPEPRRSTSPSPATQPATPTRRKAKRSRCAKRRSRTAWRCARNRSA